MNAEFVSLVDLLRPPASVANRGGEPYAEGVAAPRGDVTETLDGDLDSVSRRAPRDGDAIAAALRDARLFRARLSDALDHAAARLVRELAADVLMRELRLAPCEIAALVERVRERAPVVRVRVAAGDVGRIHGVPVLADSALDADDAIVELNGGALDARLGVRLAGVLEAFA